MRITSRLAALAAGSSLVVAGLVAAPAGAAPDPTPVDQGVSWLVKQDQAGGLYNAGANIDFLQQLVLLGRSAEADAQVTAIKAKASDYASTAEAAAKLIYAGDIADEDATGWGPGGLVQKVADGVLDTTGQLDQAYTTPGSQALAVRALSGVNGRTQHAEYDAARDYLLTQQCADGRYRDGLAATSCDADAAEGSPDATAFVVLYLGDSTDAAVGTSVTKAKEWLKQAQQADGSWKSVDSWQPGQSNSNSTGLAALAVGAGPEATKGAAWLRKAQARDAGTCTTKIAATDKGAVAFTAADYQAGTEAGLDEGMYTRGSWIYATQQSVAALQWAPANAGSLTLEGPAGYVKAGSTVKLSTRNVAPLSKGCLTGNGAKQTWTAGATGVWHRYVKAPAGTANRTYTLVDSANHKTTRVVKVLGTKYFTISRSASSVKKGQNVRVTIRGFAPGERVQLFYKGTRIRSSAASSTGVYTTTFNVGSTLGSQMVIVRGQFGDIRKGWTTVKVTR